MGDCDDSSIAYQGNSRYKTGGQTLVVQNCNERRSRSRRMECCGDPAHRIIIYICVNVLQSEFEMNEITTIKHLFQVVIVEVTL